MFVCVCLYARRCGWYVARPRKIHSTMLTTLRTLNETLCALGVLLGRFLNIEPLHSIRLWLLLLLPLCRMCEICVLVCLHVCMVEIGSDDIPHPKTNVASNKPLIFCSLESANVPALHNIYKRVQHRARVSVFCVYVCSAVYVKYVVSVCVFVKPPQGENRSLSLFERRMRRDLRAHNRRRYGTRSFFDVMRARVWSARVIDIGVVFSVSTVMIYSWVRLVQHVWQGSNMSIINI